MMVLTSCIRSLTLQKTRYKSFAVRTLSTVVLITSFILIIYWGHIPLVLMIFGLQV
jgi:hypothetical protein